MKNRMYLTEAEAQAMNLPSPQIQIERWNRVMEQIIAEKAQEIARAIIADAARRPKPFDEAEYGDWRGDHKRDLGEDERCELGRDQRWEEREQSEVLGERCPSRE